MGKGILILAVYLAVTVVGAALIRIFGHLPEEGFRKTLHLIALGALTLWLLVLPDWRMCAGLMLLFMILVYPALTLLDKVPGFSKFLTERHPGELRASLVAVSLMLIVLSTVCWGWLSDRMLAVAAVFAWGPGDAAAALIGKRFGRHKIGPGKKKSLEGTAAMFICSVLSVLAVLLLRGGLSFGIAAAASLVTGAVTAEVELAETKGYDTFFCPVAAMAALIASLHLFGVLPFPGF